MRNPEIEAVFKECADLCDTKNDDYASKEDFYANFRLVSRLRGLRQQPYGRTTAFQPRSDDHREPNGRIAVPLPQVWG